MGLDNKKIAIIVCPLSDKQIFDMYTKEQELIDAMSNYIEKSLIGIEIFSRRRNIIATESGFYAAFWVKDLQHLNHYKNAPE